MPRKKPSIFEIQEEKTRVNVTIQESNLQQTNGKPRLYGSISRRKITVRAILAEMEKNHHQLVSKELMFYVAEELSKHMMDKFKKGYAVELLDFGTIFPTMKGSIKATDTPSVIKKHFDVGFTPSKQAYAALKNYEVAKVRNVSVQHCIYSVCDLCPSERRRNSILTGRLGLIKGKGIKLGGNTSGLYAVPVPEDWKGYSLPARTQWIPITNIVSNKPSELEFYAPELKPGTYVFIVETSLSAGGKPLKNSVIARSEIVQVEAMEAKPQE